MAVLFVQSRKGEMNKQNPRRRQRQVDSSIRLENQDGAAAAQASTAAKTRYGDKGVGGQSGDGGTPT
jgi:hypothetical protein